MSALQREMIPYTPEELMALAEKELAWGEAEMRAASREMGFGDDWHAAMEKVKTMYVAPGEQPAMVRGLADEAIAYLDANKLVTVPEVARRSWRMDMLSPERQLVSPFFLGGETILVSYPTDSHDARAEADEHARQQPALLARHRAPRADPGPPPARLHGRSATSRTARLFDTPFFVEGWALYWEMLL